MILTGTTVILLLLFPSLPVWAPFIPAVVEGVLLTPALVFAGVGRSIFSRLHYWYGAVICGEVALVWRSDGREFAPVHREDGEAYAVLGDGRTVPLNDTATTWYRLGKRPLAITWDKTDPDLVDRYCQLDAVNLRAEDDDMGVLPEPRGGHHLYTTAPDAATRTQSVTNVGDGVPAADGGEPVTAGEPLLVQWPQLATELRGGGNSELSQQAERQGQRDYGGDTSLGERAMIYSGVAALLGGAASALLYLGVIA